IPTKRWVSTAIAEFIKLATEDDAHHLPDELLPNSWALLMSLYGRSEGATELPDDPMSYAINSEKGRVLDAVFAHALRRCRLEDAVRDGDHSAVVAPILAF